MRLAIRRILLGTAVVGGAFLATWVAAVRAAPAVRTRKERARASRRGAA